MAIKAQILQKIRTDGAIKLDRYMELCNRHYYATRDPFGAAGDFITAPEICQIFGEMIAIWAITAWQRIGSPKHCAVVEFGPGRGTLMADFLRAIKVMPDFTPEIHFVETSPVLIKSQKETLCHARLRAGIRIPAQGGDNIKWHSEFPKLNIPTIIIANEFFDALPIKQFVAGKEREILEDNGELYFSAQAESGTVNEVCPLAEEIMRDISTHAAAGIIIDYGYLLPNKSDTLQAVRGHKFHHPLQNPGEADLTALVNFAALKQNCLKKCDITTQAEFLLAYGGQTRAKILGLEADFDRLVNPKQMGELFKVLCF